MKFNNLGLALGTNLKFYTSVAKELKLKVRKFWGLIPTFVEITGGKLVVGGGIFAPSPVLDRVKKNARALKKPSKTMNQTPNISYNKESSKSSFI